MPSAESGAADGPALVSSPRRRRRVIKRVALGVGMTLASLFLLAAVLYSFGGKERPASQYIAAYDQLVAEGQATPVQSRFVIPIPGCRCHSDDPVAQVEHSVYRIRDCMRCH